MKFFRRYRDLHDDPEFPFRVGHLLGAVEMVGHVLHSSDDPQHQHLGEILRTQAQWFWEHRIPVAAPVPPPAPEVRQGWTPPARSEAVTEVRGPVSAPTDGGPA